MLFVLLGAGPSTAPASQFVGVPEVSFELGGERPLRMPSDVAVLSDGRVCIADGMHHRVLVFTLNGQLLNVISAADGKPLHGPTGLATDPDGALWIADAANHRVVRLDADGDAAESLQAPGDDAAHPAEVTDLAVSADGAFLWAVDNHAHRLLRLDRKAGTWSRFAKPGDARGELQFPYMIAASPLGDVFLSDVVNSQVAGFDREGRAIAGIGVYGVTRGALFRPKGVAVDGEGRVWVSDSVTGVIQIFRPTGAFLGTLDDDQSQPLRFDMPTGLAFDRAGALYVAELGANRARKVRVRETQALAAPITVRPPPPGMGQQARNCTICHLEWLPDFAQRRDELLMPAPLSDPGDPLVAKARMCLSCHDGSIVDSRRRVWESHGHATGIKPPGSMRIPDNLPLVNGAIACRTCHSAHGAGAGMSELKTAVFLRVPNAASELCISCHTDKTRGAVFGTHPTGGMPWPVPEALIKAGAKVGPNPRELTCQVCHTPHGAEYDHLLVLGVGSNQLCLQCHDQMRPGMFRSGDHLEHPLTARVNDEQRAAIAALGTRVGENGELVCLSCHKLHHGRGQRYMLADDLHEGQMCLRCHADHATLVGTAHDLRTTRPTERNRIGMTAETGGPCSSCHMFHRYARLREPTENDQSGLCMTCHSSGKCAQDAAIGSINHSSQSCSQCHNPHTAEHPPFLKAAPQTLCSGCHIEMAGVIGGPHDPTNNAAGWQAQSQAPADACLACHRPHGDEASGLFRLPATVERESLVAAAFAKSRRGDTNPDVLCVSCHQEAAFGHGERAAMHPAARLDPALAPGLPRVPDEQGGERVGCRTCHSPHAHPDQEKLLRRPAGATAGESTRESAAELCIACHTDMAPVLASGHSPAQMAQAGLDATACLPCHRAHGGSAEVAADLLWPRTMRDESALLPAVDGGGQRAASDVLCSSCHRTGGAATLPPIASHPDVPIVAAGRAGSSALPLFDADGRPSPVGRITCRTCHLPHGRHGVVEQDDSATPAERRQQRLQLRPFAAPNACTACHGDDGLRRYLYFHDPLRRRAP